MLYVIRFCYLFARGSAIAEIALVCGHYAVQGHSRSPIMTTNEIL